MRNTVHTPIVTVIATLYAFKGPPEPTACQSYIVWMMPSKIGFRNREESKKGEELVPHDANTHPILRIGIRVYFELTAEAQKVEEREGNHLDLVTMVHGIHA